MQSPKLYTRDEFRFLCLKRDNHRCVVCGETERICVHHIIERRLFPDGGYYLENGASVCETHHREAEATILSCDTLRELCKIQQVVVPPHIYRDQPVDKWCNPILPNGNRLRGDLFYDPSVQKVIEPVLHLFSKYVKYPRTFHLPWSPGGEDKNERVMTDTSQFKGKRVVVMEKMDGENTSMYNDYIHVRSVESMEAHPSRARVKALWGSICSDIPEGWRLSVENLFAKHSIHYHHLKDFAVLFAVWDDKNVCRSWDETKEWGELLGLTMCPVLYEGIYDEQLIKSLHKPVRDGDECEGYVLRVTDPFLYGEFCRWVGKYVGRNFVIDNSKHWKARMVVQNEVRALEKQDGHSKRGKDIP